MKILKETNVAGSIRTVDWVEGINLASEGTGNMPVTNLNGGINASTGTFWRGDGTWASPPGDSFIGNLQNEIAQLAYELAIVKNQSVLNLTDGVAINYNDASGINSGSSSNYYLDTTNERVINVTGVVESYGANLINYASTAGWCCICRIDKSKFNASSGSKIRIALHPGAGANGYDDMYVSQPATSGDNFDSHTDITRVTFNNGNNSVTVPANTVVWSDWIDYAFDGTKDLMVCADVSNSSLTSYKDSETGFTTYLKSATKNAGTQNRTGFSTHNSRRAIISGLEVLSNNLNMTLVSTVYTAATVPSSAAFIIQFVDVNSNITLNTDLTVEISRDGGTTWTTLTLTNLRTSGTTIIANGTISLTSQPSGTSLRSRIKTPGASPKRSEIVAHTLQIE